MSLIPQLIADIESNYLTCNEKVFLDLIDKIGPSQYEFIQQCIDKLTYKQSSLKEPRAEYEYERILESLKIDRTTLVTDINQIKQGKGYYFFAKGHRYAEYDISYFGIIRVYLVESLQGSLEESIDTEEYRINGFMEPIPKFIEFRRFFWQKQTICGKCKILINNAFSGGVMVESDRSVNFDFVYIQSEIAQVDMYPVPEKID